MTNKNIKKTNYTKSDFTNKKVHFYFLSLDKFSSQYDKIKLETKYEVFYTLTPQLPTCLVSGEADMVYKGEKTKEELWDKYHIQAPAQHRKLVEKHKIVRRA